jgi:hypothetical protein
MHEEDVGEEGDAGAAAGPGRHLQMAGRTRLPALLPLALPTLTSPTLSTGLLWKHKEYRNGHSESRR